MLGPPLPSARVHQTALGRLGATLALGPTWATDGWLRWALTQAGVGTLAHAALFLIVAFATMSGHSGGLGAEALLGVFLLVAAVVLGSVEWLVSLAAMAIVAQAGRGLGRLPRAPARLLGVVLGATAALAIEPAAAALFHTIAVGQPGWDLGFWLVAAAVGAAWGAWLPGVFGVAESADVDRHGAAAAAAPAGR